MVPAVVSVVETSSVAAGAALPAASVMITLLVLQASQVPISLFHTMAMFLVVGLGMGGTVIWENPNHIETAGSAA